MRLRKQNFCRFKMQVENIRVGNCPAGKAFAVFLEDGGKVKRGDLVGENPTCEHGNSMSTHHLLGIPNIDIVTIATNPDIILQCKTLCLYGESNHCEPRNKDLDANPVDPIE